MHKLPRVKWILRAAGYRNCAHANNSTFVYSTFRTSALSVNVRFAPILLQKSFWGGERKFFEPLMRFTRGDVRDHIVSFQIDPGPS
jgi:hypothetical protein